MGVGAVAASALSFGVPCPLLALTGIPCPGCGMTRLADALTHGHLVGAVGSDPLGVVLVAAIAALALVGAARRFGLPVSLPAGAARAVPAAIAGLLAVRWLAVLAGLGPAIT